MKLPFFREHNHRFVVTTDSQYPVKLQVTGLFTFLRFPVYKQIDIPLTEKDFENYKSASIFAEGILSHEMS